MKKLIFAGVFAVNLFLAGCVNEHNTSTINRVATLRTGMTVAQVHHHIPAQDRISVHVEYRKNKHLVEYVSLAENNIELGRLDNANRKNLYLLVYKGHKHPKLQAWGFARNLQRDKDRVIRTLAQKAAIDATVLHKGARRELAMYITKRRAQYMGTETIVVQGQNVDVDYFKDKKNQKLYLVTYNYQGKVMAFGYPADFKKSKQSFKVALGNEAVAIYNRT